MKYNKLFFILILISSMLTSCEDILEALPENKIPQETFWQTAGNVRAFVADIYSRTFPVEYEMHPCFDEGMSDNSYMQWEGWYTDIKLIGNGSYTTTTSVINNNWAYAYTNIRMAWQFMENIDRCAELDASERESLTGQVRFFMAYSYIRLVALYGDVPLIRKVLTEAEVKELTRTPKAEVLAFAHEQLDLAIRELEGKTLEKGRVTAGACLALKARAYLWENDYANVLTVTPQLIGKYSLNTAGETPYADLFNGNAENSDEIILAREFAHTSGSISTGQRLNQAFFLKGMSGGDALGGLTPTGSLVDAYPMADGRLIHENGSTYDPRNPYKDRDPRLAQSIIYPTSTIRSSATMEWVLYDPEDERTLAGQRYDDKEPSPTGYAWKKYCDWSDHAMIEILDGGVDVIYFRYADVLLMHAEALLETQGIAAASEIFGIIDQLRDRCGGGRVTQSNYTTVEALRTLVRNERRIELANEGLRFFDLRRWRTAEKTAVTDGEGMNGDLYGAFMRKDGIGSTDATIDIDGVPRRYVEKRNFDPDRHYLFPIPGKEIDLTNGTLTQNPGWD